MDTSARLYLRLLHIRFPLGETKYLIFFSPRCRQSAAFEFRHSICNASRIRKRKRKLVNKSVLMETECLNTGFPGSLCLACYVVELCGKERDAKIISVISHRRAGGQWLTICEIVGSNIILSKNYFYFWSEICDIKFHHLIHRHELGS